jgi:hypothetical protein
MRQKIKHYVLALDDTALLTLYAACWLLALFAPADNQVGLATVGHVLSALAVMLVALFWIARPAFRPGWRWRDGWLIAIVLLAVFEAYHAVIRQAAVLDLLHTLELAAIFLTATYLCARRPQPLFVVTGLLLLAATGIAWRWRQPLFPSLDPVTLAQITAVMLLALLPWLAVRRLRGWRRWYHWVVLLAAGALLVLDAVSGWGGRSDRIRSLAGSLPAETRQMLGSILHDSWLLGCGPGNYEWLFRAGIPEEFAGQTATLPGLIVLLAESGVLGLVVMLGFGLATIWRFRPGPWAAHHEEVLDLARTFRWATAFVFLLFLATPGLRSFFGQIVLWSLFGIMRAWSSRESPAAVWLVAGGTDEAVVRSVTVESRSRWQQPFLVIGAVLAGIGLVLVQIRPVIGKLYQRPGGMDRSDAAYLDRLETSLWWWPYDPRTYELEAVHYRAKANAGLALSTVEIKAVALAYEQMVRANPYNPGAHHALARWHTLLGDVDQAVEATRRGLSYCPASFELQYLLAGSYRRLGNIALARNAYERARLLRPHSLPVLRHLAALELRLGNTRQAQRWLKMAQQVAPNDPALRAMLEAIAAGRSADAVEQLETGTQEESDPSRLPVYPP